MNEKQIKDRITELVNERNALDTSHNEMLQENQKANQQFQQRVVQNQTRFAQIIGAITELQKLVQPQPQKDNNHDNSIPTPDFSDRFADVRAGEQPEGR